MDLELDGKVVLVTGGTDGLGLALAAQLVSEGASVAVCGRDEARLGEAEARLSGGPGDVLARRADVTSPEDLAAFVTAATTRWGRIDGVVHNAGRASAGRIDVVDDDTWAADIELKLMAAVRLTRLTLPHLRTSKGAVLFTLSITGKAPPGASEPTSVSRAAGMALMKALSKELAPDGIRVNAVLIGLIESGQWVPPRPRLRERTSRSSTSGPPRARASRSAASGAPRSSPTSVVTCSQPVPRT